MVTTLKVFHAINGVTVAIDGILVAGQQDIQKSNVILEQPVDVNKISQAVNEQNEQTPVPVASSIE